MLPPSAAEPLVDSCMTACCAFCGIVLVADARTPAYFFQELLQNPGLLPRPSQMQPSASLAPAIAGSSAYTASGSLHAMPSGQLDVPGTPLFPAACAAVGVPWAATPTHAAAAAAAAGGVPAQQQFPPGWSLYPGYQGPPPLGSGPPQQQQQQRQEVQIQVQQSVQMVQSTQVAVVQPQQQQQQHWQVETLMAPPAQSRQQEQLLQDQRQQSVPLSAPSALDALICMHVQQQQQQLVLQAKLQPQTVDHAQSNESEQQVTEVPAEVDQEQQQRPLAGRTMLRLSTAKWAHDIQNSSCNVDLASLEMEPGGSGCLCLFLPFGPA